MQPSYKRLIDRWAAQGLKIATGATDGEVVSFESQNAVVLPEDFRNYFLKVNGMVQDFENSCDRIGFAFWPLSLVTSVTKECAKRSSPVPALKDPERYFVFADYLQWSWAYAIHLDANSPDTNQVIHVGTLRPKVIANSFTAFVNLYLQDARELYTDAA